MARHPDDLTQLTAHELARRRARALRRWFGKPTGAQKHLLERLLGALVVDFEEGGADAIRKLRDSDPLNYLRLIAVMVPKPSDARAGRPDDEEIIDALATVRELAAAHAESLGKCIEGDDVRPPAADLPALPQADRVP